jgi:hypothetical protein
MKFRAGIAFNEKLRSARRFFVGMKPLFSLSDDSRGSPTLPRMLACPAEVPKPPFWILLVQGSTDWFFRKTRLSRLCLAACLGFCF